MSRRMFMGLFATLLSLTAAVAQQPAAPTATPPANSAANPAAPGGAAASGGVTPEQLLARRLTHTARIILQAPPSPARLTVARSLLQQAVTLEPANAEWWRLLIEAAELAGDTAELRKDLAAYLKLAPTDDAAQLRLIQLVADDQQTVAERVATLQRFVDAAQLSRPLRSRIALRAAILKRDAGDFDGYAALLKSAITLDEANPAAAAEAYALLRQRGGTATELAQALFHLVSADPVNVDAHAQIASTMLAAGQYRQAMAWYESVNALYGTLGAPDAATLVNVISDWALAMWGADRSADAVKLIDSFRASMQQVNASAPLPLALASTLVAIHSGAGNKAGADAAFNELFTALKAAADADSNDAGAAVDLAAACVLFNQRIDEAAASVARLEKMLPENDTTLQRLRGWLKLRQGDSAEAAKLLTPLAQRDILADFALCLIPGFEEAGPRLSRLNRVYAAAPGTMIGIMAGDLIRQAGARGQVSAEATAIARLEQHVNEKIRRVATSPLQFVLLKVKPVKLAADFAEPLDVELELTNVSGMPLSLGPGGVLPTNVMLATGVTIDRKAFPQRALTIASFARRLRLEAGASLTIRAPIDGEPIHNILIERPNSEVQLRTTATLNAVPVKGGGFRPGLLGMIQGDRPVIRNAWKGSSIAADRMMAVVKSGAPGPRLLATALLIRVAPLVAGSYATEGDRISDHLIEEIKKWNPVEQAAALSYINEDLRARKLFGGVLDAAVRSNDLLIQQVLLVTQINSTEEPMLFAALRRDPGPIRSFAEAYQALLVEAAQVRAERSGAGQPTGAPGDSTGGSTPAAEPSVPGGGGDATSGDKDKPSDANKKE